MKSNILTSLSEHKEQSLLCRYLDLHRINYFAVPNGVWAKGGIGMIAKLKREGMKTGVPDLIIIDPLIAIEMKKARNGKHKLPCKCLSPEQREWKSTLEACGWKYILAHGFEDAKEQLINLHVTK